MFTLSNRVTGEYRLRYLLLGFCLVVLLASSGGAQAPSNVTTVPTLTKGTQGSTGFSVQQLKDAGRTLVTMTIDSVGPIAGEGLLTFNKLVGDTRTTGVTTYPVSSGKTLRLQSISLTFASNTTTVNKVRVRLRTLSSGSCLGTSPLVGTWDLTWPTPATPVIGAPGMSITNMFPDGMEFSGANRNVCFSSNATAANGFLSMTVIGYEY